MSTVGTAIVEILEANTALTAVVGDKIFFSKAPKGTENPCLVYNLDDSPEDYKGGSGITNHIVQIDTYTDNKGTRGAELAKLVRDALDRQSGTFATDVEIQTITYAGGNSFHDPSGSYRYLQNFRVRQNT